MKRVMTGLAALAASLVAPAAAADGPRSADLWIGLDGSTDGFLIDEDTGDVWMTGPCLKTLSPAQREGDIWTSTTSEMVSVGRLDAFLSQTFRLDTREASPSISVENTSRGGVQSFPGAIRRACGDGACDALITIPPC